MAEQTMVPPLLFLDLQIEHNHCQIKHEIIEQSFANKNNLWMLFEKGNTSKHNKSTKA
jgi:hypothetical protein